jgi:hypothetical protein
MFTSLLAGHASTVSPPTISPAQRLFDAVLFDRDGTLIEDVPYNGSPDKVRPMPGAREALERVREHASGQSRLVGHHADLESRGTHRLHPPAAGPNAIPGIDPRLAAIDVAMVLDAVGALAALRS